MNIIDPMALKEMLWPSDDYEDAFGNQHKGVTFYDKQIEIIYSVEDNDETYVPAGNQLGKDFVTGFIVLAAFLRHREVRIVTTSVKDDHLRVLWGEIGRFVETAKHPLDRKKGGPLVLNHRDIRKVVKTTGKPCPISYLRGMVSERGEGLAGHHAPHTLAVGDEASGIDEQAYVQFQGWAKRMLFIGNPNPPSNKFFKDGVTKGDLLAN